MITSSGGDFTVWGWKAKKLNDDRMDVAWYGGGDSETVAGTSALETCWSIAKECSCFRCRRAFDTVATHAGGFRSPEGSKLQGTGRERDHNSRLGPIVMESKYVFEKDFGGARFGRQ